MKKEVKIIIGGVILLLLLLIGVVIFLKDDPFKQLRSQKCDSSEIILSFSLNSKGEEYDIKCGPIYKCSNGTIPKIQCSSFLIDDNSCQLTCFNKDF